jgi:hypothetical protein
MMGLNVPVSAECEPDKSNRDQDDAGNDQPMWIFHLSIPRSRSSRSLSISHYIPRGAYTMSRAVIMIAVSKLSVR